MILGHYFEEYVSVNSVASNIVRQQIYITVFSTNLSRKTIILITSLISTSQLSN